MDLKRGVWHHAPVHLFMPGANYIVTCGTLNKEHLLNAPPKLSLVRDALLEHCEEFKWTLEAWAVLSNHYHFVAKAPDDNPDLDLMLKSLHSNTARELNVLDGAEGRSVWYQYRDTCLTDHKSYLARLHYVHRNPESHKVVARAEDYEWCSMRWFLGRATPAFRRSVLSFKIDRVKVQDDF